MAVTVVETNNKLIRFTEQISRELVRENMFSPYMSESLTAIIRLRNELKAGGEDMNIPIVTRLTGQGVATTTLVGNEEKIDNYGMRLRMEWARNAIVTNKAESHKDSADIFGESKPLLADWAKELQRDEMIAALMALPTETLPSSSSGVRVNGIQYELATALERDAWHVANGDRIVYGAAVANGFPTVTVHATALGNLDTTADKFTATNLSLLKRVAKLADPKIRPYRTEDGYEHYVVFAGTNTFRDLKISLETINKDARAREGRGMDKNPIFQDGDQLYDGCIVREVPEISRFVGSAAVPGPWFPILGTAGATSARVEPVFFCGQQAAVIGWGQMPKPTFRKEDDYGFITGTGIEMAYGMAKMFKKHPMTGTALKQWGMATGFYAASGD